MERGFHFLKWELNLQHVAFSRKLATTGFILIQAIFPSEIESLIYKYNVHF